MGEAHFVTSIRFNKRLNDQQKYNPDTQGSQRSHFCSMVPGICWEQNSKRPFKIFDKSSLIHGDARHARKTADQP